MVEGFHHAAVTVTDIARARHFYSDVLGLQEIPRPPFDFDGAWYDVGDRHLHLIVHPPSQTRRGTRTIDPRDGHLALRVSDYEATLTQLRAHGIAVMEQRQNRTPWMQMYITDPDGNVIELNVERPLDTGEA
jgi:catechol 2,3-dioxygenase-like lactoylglutathione lyase family enzyme